MRPDISRIDDDENIVPDNSDFEDFDEDEEQEEPDCYFCAGTGEGASPDVRCGFCNGRGTIKKRKY